MSVSYTVRHATHPQEVKSFDTPTLRDRFLIDTLFVEDQINLVYTLHDRFIVGGVQPKSQPLKLTPIDPLKANFFLERRELGVINVGNPGSITVDGVSYNLDYKEALYIGQGTKEVIFHPATKGNAKYYLNSAPAHKSYPHKKIGLKDADTMELGSLETSNHRIIRKLIVHGVVNVCQLQMGLTELQPGSVWNTMPAHTHDRRMEVYFYFEVKENQAVCHYMGEPQETRHIWMQTEQAVISPPWSIHCGAGTNSYSFIWGMAGENLDYGDMDTLSPIELR